MDYTGVQQSDPIGAPETQWRMTRWQAAASRAGPVTICFCYYSAGTQV
jgi:hypothetical protein